jgi:alpha,alpha-trehalase
MSNEQPELSTLLPADQYYGTSHESRRTTRTYSWSHRNDNKNNNKQAAFLLFIFNLDEQPIQARKFLLPVEETIRVVLEQEDTNGDFQISITNSGPKLLSVGTVSSNGYKKFDVSSILYSNISFFSL